MNDANPILATSSRAFYSIVQYCPDLARLEAANVGVVVFRAEPAYLGVKMSENPTRVAKMFGLRNHDLTRLKTFLSGLQERLSSDRDGVKSLEQLNQLAAMQVNVLRMTPFMPCRVSEQPAEDVDRMFQELVEPIKSIDSPASRVPLKQMLEGHFSAHEIAIRIRRKVKVRIPYLGRDEEIPYAYQNGRLNLIAPVTFPKNQSTLEERASKYALEGQSLFEVRDPQLGDMQMLVVGQFEADETNHIRTARRILEDHHVRLFSSEDLPMLLHEIRTLGHVVSA